MFVKSKQNATQIDDLRAVDLQRDDCGATRRLKPDNFQVIGAPSEMLIPFVAVWVE